jgi:hypothetical protein
VLSFDPDDIQHARSFSLAEVKAMTQNYAKKLGQGSYGPVYYGKLPDGLEVAVKVNSKDSRQGTTEFINEVKLVVLAIYDVDAFLYVWLTVHDECVIVPYLFRKII